jgi:D-sedoheptulose 7-phosphate isomerase
MTDGYLDHYMQGYLGRLKHTIDAVPVEAITAMGETLFRAYQHNKQVFIIGNGGSAATASHMACDLGKNTIGPNRRRFRVLSLTDNMPLVSALANDIGYESVFSEQLVNLIRPGDVLIVVSASGHSTNIINAMRYARGRAATIIALLGFDGGEAAELADECVVIPATDYGLVEDLHMVLNHVLVGYFRERLEQEEEPAPA